MAGLFSAIRDCGLRFDAEIAERLLRFALTPKPKRGLVASDPGEVVDPLAWRGRHRAMETAQHRDKSAKDQVAEITMFQISEVQESPAFNGRRSLLTLRHAVLQPEIRRV